MLWRERSSRGRPSEISQKAMSALPPKADMCSAQPHVCFGPIADIVASFDHFVSRQKNAIGDTDAKCSGGFEVDHKLKFSGLLDWQFGRFRAFQNSRHVIRGSTPQWRQFDTVGH